MKIHYIPVIRQFLRKYKEDHVSAFASQSAFFLFLSFVPFLLVLLTLIQYLPIEKEKIIESITMLFPKETDPLITATIERLYTKISSSLLSMSIITALWSSSRTILAITRGLNNISGTVETKNYVILRLFSMLYTFLFSICLFLLLLLLVFGNYILQSIIHFFPLLQQILEQVLPFRFLFFSLFLLFFFCCTYAFIPSQKLPLKKQLPGAIFSTVGWLILSFAFSIYVQHFSSFHIYGSLASIMILMLWLYANMTIFFIGAEINQFFYVIVNMKL